MSKPQKHIVSSRHFRCISVLDSELAPLEVFKNNKNTPKKTTLTQLASTISTPNLIYTWTNKKRNHVVDNILKKIGKVSRRICSFHLYMWVEFRFGNLRHHGFLMCQCMDFCFSIFSLLLDAIISLHIIYLKREAVVITRVFQGYGEDMPRPDKRE